MNLKMFVLLSAWVVVSASCKKKGCIDENAVNYSHQNEKDDGSCYYPTVATIGSIQITRTDLSSNTYPTVDVSITLEYKGQSYESAIISGEQSYSWTNISAFNISSFNINDSIMCYEYDHSSGSQVLIHTFVIRPYKYYGDINDTWQFYYGMPIGAAKSWMLHNRDSDNLLLGSTDLHTMTVTPIWQH